MTTSRLPFSIYEHEASEEDKARILKSAQFLSHRLYMKKFGDTVKCYCTQCASEYEVTPEIAQQIKESSRCFKCGNGLKAVNRWQADRKPKREWISICNEKGCENGYEVIWHMEKGIAILDTCDHVLHFDGKDTWLYRIQKTIGYSLGTVWDSSKWAWRKERKYGYYGNSYLNYFANVTSLEEMMQSTKRQYYESLDLPELKSNQRKFIMDGIYSHNQIMYIHHFDLNYPEQVHRYRKYINAHRIPITIGKYSENILKYISENGYGIAEYNDYAKACKEVGIKPGKPKDLRAEHDRVTQMVQLKRNKKYAEQIIARRPSLLDKEWKYGKYAVHVFSDMPEMISIAKHLHNCIGRMYVEPYAEQRTDVYYGTKGDSITFAFEINCNRLVQLRADQNKAVDKETEAFVHRWCRKYGYAY